MSEFKQVHIYYSGRVQGVGFRFTVRSFAADVDLKGWVRNLPDGRVEIKAEGELPVLERFHQRLEEQFEGYILQRDIRFDKAKGGFEDFRIL